MYLKLKFIIQAFYLFRNKGFKINLCQEIMIKSI